MNLRGVKYRKTGELSRLVLYVMIALAVLVFSAFYIIGYESPYEEDPRFNAPMFTDVLIGFTVLLLVAALAVGAWAVVTGIKKRDKDGDVVNGVPVARIFYGVAAFTVLVMLVTFVFGSPSSVVVNGKVFADAVWLRIADMFVVTSLVMILCAAGAIVFVYASSYFKKGNGSRALNQ